MGMFSDVLITADFDRTLTAPDSTVPERNLEAIRYFMENGGAFTVNTGRSLAMSRRFLERIPVNAPVLLFNGSAAYDTRKEKLLFCHTIDLPMEQVVRQALDSYPDMIVEIQGLDAHYIFEPNDTWIEFRRINGCTGRVAKADEDLGPFIKMCVYGQLKGENLGNLFEGTAQEIARCDQVETDLRERYGDRMVVLRVAKRIVDLHAAGTSKGRAARELLEQMGRKILVCIGDEQNDVSMLDAADHAYCPGDAAIADRYENVCPCAEGAVADVIYKKLPEILGIQP